jgi:hypothetical protein
MSNANSNIPFSICSLEYLVEQSFFPVFKIPSQGIGANVGNLNHARQFRINEQWRLDYMLNLCPEGSLQMKGLHQIGVPFCHRLIVVVDQHPKRLQARGLIHVSQELFEARNQLLKCLLIERLGCPIGSK